MHLQDRVSNKCALPTELRGREKSELLENGKHKRQTRARDTAQQYGTCLPHTHKLLSLIPSSKKKKANKMNLNMPCKREKGRLRDVAQC